MDEKAAEVHPDLDEIWSLLQEQWGPCAFCSLTPQQCPPHSLCSSPAASLLFLKYAKCTLTTGPLHLLSLLPEILPPNPRELHLAFIQDTAKVTFPKSPLYPPYQNQSLIPSLSIPWPDVIFFFRALPLP